MSFRKEKKYQISYSETVEIKKKFYDSGMTSLYPQRIINSLYFDTKNFQLFKDSEEGVLPRKKIRIRWYKNIKAYTKEIKISSVEGRYKIKEPFNFSHNLEDIGIFDRQYGHLFPSLIIQYEREYFLFRNVRITFDRNITYNNLNHITKPTYHDNMCVMEIKTPIDLPDDYIEKIFQYPTSRFSKYCRGLLHTSKLAK